MLFIETTATYCKKCEYMNTNIHHVWPKYFVIKFIIVVNIVKSVL